MNQPSAATPPDSLDPGGFERGNSRSPFVPLLLVVIAALAVTALQTAQLWFERETLATIHEAQETQIQESQKMRAALDRIASDTARLSDQGNASARLLVNELSRRGVTIKYQEAPATEPGTK